MTLPILATKLYAPPPRTGAVQRPRLIERLNAGLSRRLTLISAPAGTGKSTLASGWAAVCGRPAAWLSLDEGDGDPARFLTYLVAALQTLGPPTRAGAPAPRIGEGLMGALLSPQPPPAQALLAALINEIATGADPFLLVLDDLHAVESPAVDDALAFLVERLPPQMHLAIVTREDPQLPLARLRARGELTELRAAELRFTPGEAAEFLNGTMGLGLPAEQAAALEARTEGWIAGLQMAAVSLQGSPDRAAFVRSFAGSHRFVLDYLVSEVLEGQPAGIRQFLLLTAVLGRMCASLCEAVTLGAPGSGQAALEALERANLFLIPLDDERRWYRYHRLFADLLRQRLEQGARPDAADGDLPAPAVLHARASAWFEANGLPLEAFRHAALSGDIARADRLSDSRRLPVHLRSVSSEVIAWLDALPAGELDARPALRVKSATLCLLAGITTGVEAKLQAAEAALGARATGIPAPSGLEASAGLTRQAATQSPETRTPGGDDPAARALAGRIAAARATLALSQYRADEILPQARRALELLPPDDLSFRFTAVYTLAFAHLLMGDRDAAGHAYAEALAISREAGDPWSLTLALGGVAELQEMDNRLQEAAETYGAMLPLLGDHPQPNAGEAYLGLARIAYEWNDLADAEAHARRGLELSSQYDRAVDRFVPCEVFLARLALARGDAARAAAMLAETAETVRRRNFLLRLPEVAAAQAVAALRLGDLAAAARLAGDHDLPLIRARVLLARGNPAAALEVAEPLSRAMAARNWADERLRSRVLEALACDALGDRDAALRLLGDLLAQAEPERFVRTFLDEGPPMARLLSAAAARGIVPGYAARLAAAFETEPQRLPGGGRPSQPADAHRAGATAGAAGPGAPGPRPPVEPLSARELEVLRLVADGLTNQEIAGRLFLALDTVKGHNRRIFEKLQVQRRTEAVARARELDLL